MRYGLKFFITIVSTLLTSFIAMRSMADLQLLFPENQVSSRPIVEFRAREKGVGHAFLFLGHEVDNGGTIFYGVAGFYPEKGNELKSIKNVLYGPGEVTYKFDDLHADKSFRVYVNEDQELAVKTIITGWNDKKYSIAWQNCTYLVRDVATALNLEGTNFSVSAIMPYAVVDGLAKSNNSNRPLEIAARDHAFMKSQSKLDAVAGMSDAALKDELEQQKNSELYLKAVDVLAAKQTDNEIKRKMIDQRNNIEKLFQRVKDINKSLQLALIRSEEAAAFQEKLKGLLTAAQIASLAIQAGELFPGAGVSGSEDIITLRRKLNNYKVEMDGYILRYQSQLALQKRLTTEEAARLKPLLEKSGGNSGELNLTID